MTNDETALRVEKKLYRGILATSKELILSDHYQDTADPYRQEFAKGPDAASMHSPGWHQWGVLTHTAQMGAFLRFHAAGMIRDLFGESAGRSYLGLSNEEIEGVSKSALLKCSAPVHDWGKFTCRTFEGHKDGVPVFGFNDHEAESGRLVRLFADQLIEWGLTPAQVEYIARCAELHYELGKIRKAAKASPLAYTLAWTQAPEFEATVEEAAAENPGFEREIGILFWADSSAKTDLEDAMPAHDDDAIEAARPGIEAQISRRSLDKSLIVGALQLPVNMSVAFRYLLQLKGAPG